MSFDSPAHAESTSTKKTFKEVGIGDFLKALESLTPIEERLMRYNSLIALEFSDATQGLGVRMLDDGPNLSDIPRLMSDFEERNPGMLHPIEQGIVSRFLAVVQDFRDSLAFKVEEARKIDPEITEEGPSLPEEYVQAERNFYLMRRRLIYKGREDLALLLGRIDFQIAQHESRAQIPSYLLGILAEHRSSFHRSEIQAIEDYARAFALLKTSNGRLSAIDQ